MTRQRPLIVYLVACFVALGSTLRYVGYFVSHPSRWLILGLLIAFYALFATFPRVFRRSHLHVHLFLTVQTCLLLVLAVVTTIEDVVALPFLSLILLATTIFPLKIGFRWIALFTVLMIGSMIVYGIVLHDVDKGMILFTAVVYVASYLGFGVLMAFVRQLEIARNEAEAARLENLKQQSALLEAQKALRQSELEKAITAERNRLARDLHDSVTQALYSQTLYAEAASRLLAAGDVKTAAEHVGELRQMAQQALQEMRLLIFELRPSVLEEEGIVAALQMRLESVEGRSGFTTEFKVEGTIDLPAEVEEGLYWISQEVLNNIVKHSQASQVAAAITQTRNAIALDIADNGTGFDATTQSNHGGLGLRGIQERADRLGGQMIVESQPGQGTRVRVEVTL